MMPTRRCCVRHQLELGDAYFATDCWWLMLELLAQHFLSRSACSTEQLAAAPVKLEEAVFLLYFLRLLVGCCCFDDLLVG
ncbi:hypothetical protein Nepgr_033644 [Nepenthes gracilis]|uniref:Uncharacterized protein n=1 Tax=Nepenthes gracilis TaxID=150966 RepID=A0AAD3Y8I9_NEPGR|nr:hypothetical protein Nepgr_033644 [Nepenthes gracilis]